MRVSSKAVLLSLCVLVAAVAFAAGEEINGTADVELRQALEKTSGTISPEIKGVIEKWEQDFQSTSSLADENVELKAQIARLQDSLDVHKEHEQSMDRTIAALNAQVERLQQRLDEYKEDLQGSEKTSIDSDLILISLKNNNTALNNELSELKKRYENLRDKLQLVEAEKKEDEADLALANKKKEELQKRVIIQAAENEQLKKKLKDAKLEISSLQLTNANLEMQKSKNAKKMLEIQTSVAVQSENQLKLQADLNTKNNEIQNLHAKVAALKQKNNDLSNKIYQLENNIQNCIADVEKIGNDKSSLAQQNSQISIELTTALKNTNNLKNTVSELKNQVTKLQENLGSASNTAKSLQDEIAYLKFNNAQLNNNLAAAYDDNAKLNKAISELQKEINYTKQNAKETQDELQRQIFYFIKQNEKTADELQEEEHQGDILEVRVAGLVAKEKELINIIDAAEDTEDSLESEVKSLKLLIQQIHENANNTSQDLQNKIIKLENENKKLKGELQNEAKDVAELTDDLESIEEDLKEQNVNAKTCLAENSNLRKIIQEITQQKIELLTTLENEINTIKTQDTKDINKLKWEKQQVEDELNGLQEKYKLADRKNTDLSTILTEVTEITITKEIESFDKSISPVVNDKTSIESLRKQLEYVETKLRSNQATPEDVNDIMQKLIVIKKSIIERVGNVQNLDLEKEKQECKAQIEKEEQRLKSEQTKLLSQANNSNSSALIDQLRDLTTKSRDKMNNIWRSFYEKERGSESLTLIETLYDRCVKIQSNDYCMNVQSTETGLAASEDQVFDTSELLEILKYKCEDYLNRYNEKLEHLFHKINNAQIPEPYEGLFGILDNGKQDKYQQFSVVWDEYKDRVRRAFEPTKRLTPHDGKTFTNWVQKMSEDDNGTTYYIITTTTQWIDEENGVQTRTVSTQEVRNETTFDDNPFNIRKALQEVLDINNHEVQPEEIANQIVRSSNALVSKFWVDADALVGKEEEEISKEDHGNILIRLAKVDVMSKYLEPYFEGVENKFDSVFAQIKEEADNSYGQPHTPRPVIQLALH